MSGSPHNPASAAAAVPPASAPVPTSSQPIPIRGGANGGAGRTGPMAAAEPDARRTLLRAPVIGSLPRPHQLESLMPALDLPPASPDSISLAAILTAETTQRLVGVSSAPARSFIEHARSASAALGTSPTVLSILQQRGEHLHQKHLLRSSAASSSSASSASSALAAAEHMRRLNLGQPGAAPADGLLQGYFKQAAAGPPHQYPHHVHASAIAGSAPAAHPRGSVLFALAGASGADAPGPNGNGTASWRGQNSGSGGHVVPVLATSFRDPAHMPPPLPEDMEGEACSDDSADDALGTSRGRRAQTAPKAAAASSAALAGAADEEEDDDDEDEEPRHAKLSSALDADVFGEL